MKHLEDNLQEACVTWFRLQYPKFASLLFAIPNGGKRDAREAERMKRQGVTAGVPDLFLAIPNNFCYGMFIELKCGKNMLTAKQKEMIVRLSSMGYLCNTVRTLDHFIAVVGDYLKNQ
jgi:hypothetical protein